MKKIKGRERRHKKIRKKISGTADRPRMVIYRSLKNLYVQLVDDVNRKTILSLSTGSADVKKEIGYGGNVKAATTLGSYVARKSKEKGIKRVVFDRSGYAFHGRVKAVAEAALKDGLTFRKEKGASNSDGKQS